MEWLDGLAAGLTTLLTALLLGAFALLALREPEVVDGAVTLRYPRMMRGVLWIGVVMIAGAAVAVLWPFFAGNATAKDARGLGVGLPFILVFGWACAGELRVALDLDLDGIRGQTAFRGKRAIAWADVTEVKWSLASQWFVLVDRRGEKIRVSSFLQGHQALPAMLREKVPAEIWKKAVAAWEKQKARSPF